MSNLGRKTPDGARIIIKYSKSNNIGFCDGTEIYKIAGKNEEALLSMLKALFHVLRNTEGTKNHDSHKIASIMKDDTVFLTITQKKDDFDLRCFTVTDKDGKTKKVTYNATKCKVFEIFGFELTAGLKRGNSEVKAENTSFDFSNAFADAFEFCDTGD